MHYTENATYLPDIWWCPCRPLSAQSASELEPDNNNSYSLIITSEFPTFRVNKMKFDNEISLMEDMEEAGDAR